MDLDKNKGYAAQGKVIFLYPLNTRGSADIEQRTLCWHYSRNVPLGSFVQSCFQEGADSLDLILEADFVHATIDRDKSKHVPIVLQYEANSSSIPLRREGGRVAILYYSLQPKVSRPSLREGASFPWYTALMREARVAIDYFLRQGFQEVRMWESFHPRDPNHVVREFRMSKTRQQKFDPDARPSWDWR